MAVSAAVAVVLDSLIAVLAYSAAYWLRFSGDAGEAYPIRFESTLPVVVALQVAGLWLCGAYRRDPPASWPIRATLGAVVGTAISVAVVVAWTRFEGVSRSALIGDAFFLVIATTAWRGAVTLWWRFSHAPAAAPAADHDGLIDRATEMTTIGSVVAGIYQYRELLRSLVLKDLKLKYRGSVFGFLWSLANPLLMIVVYTVAFTYIMRIRGEGFVFSLMLGMLSWTFFSSSATMSTNAIVDNAGLLKSVLFPRAILPVGTVLFNLSQYLLTVSVFLPVMMLWYQVPLAKPMLLFPVFLVLQALFTTGIALLLSAWTAFFRDVRHLLEVALAMLFWTTPIVYELRQVPESMRLLVLLSPVSPFITAYQQMFYYQTWPEPTVCLVATTHAIAAFVIGALVFLALEDRFTEQL